MLRQWISRWYAVDRVRVTPWEGRLARLAVGERFIWRKQRFAVIRRTSDQDRILLTLRDDLQSATMSFRRREPEHGELIWQGKTFTITDEDIVPIVGIDLAGSNLVESNLVESEIVESGAGPEPKRLD